MTISAHAVECVKKALPWLVLVCILGLLAGCRSGGSITDLFPWNWGKAGKVENLPSDPSQGQVALWVAGPIGATAALLMVSGAVLWLMGNPSRGIRSALAGVVLIIINGAVITLLKSATAVWILLGLTLTGTIFFLVIDARDGVMFWKRKQNGVNACSQQPSSSPPASASAGGSSSSPSGSTSRSDDTASPSS